MVLLTASKHVSDFIGPRLVLPISLAIRRHLPLANSPPSRIGSNIFTGASLQNFWDGICGLPLAQTMTRVAFQEALKSKGSKNSNSNSNNNSNAADLHQRSQERLETLSTILQPSWSHLHSILSSSREISDSSDDHQSQEVIPHPRLLLWIRQLTLTAYYGPYVHDAFQAYPQLALSPQLTRTPVHQQLLQWARGNTTSDTTDKDNADRRRQQQQQQTKEQDPKSKTMPLSTSSLNSHHRFHPSEQYLRKLPTTKSILQAFQLESSMRNKSSERQEVTTTTANTSRIVSKSSDNLIEKSKGEKENVEDHLHHLLLPKAFNQWTQGRGGLIEELGPLNVICEESNIYQLWTREYIQHLAEYLMSKQQQLQHQLIVQHASNDKIDNHPILPKLRVLEIGAGDGLLTQALQEACRNIQYKNSVSMSVGNSKKKTIGNKIKNRKRGSHHRIPRPHFIPSSSSTSVSAVAATKPSLSTIPEFIATDNGSWRIFPKAPVERLSVEEALQKYAISGQAVEEASYDDNEADINDNDGQNNKSHNMTSDQLVILCSWMPADVDWTPLFRKAQVDEYILIGEADNGASCGTYETWTHHPGYQRFQQQRQGTTTTNTTTNTNSSKDVLDHILAPYQFSRFDTLTKRTGRTICFSKEQE